MTSCFCCCFVLFVIFFLPIPQMRFQKTSPPCLSARKSPAWTEFSSGSRPCRLGAVCYLSQLFPCLSVSSVNCWVRESPIPELSVCQCTPVFCIVRFHTGVSCVRRDGNKMQPALFAIVSTYTDCISEPSLQSRRVSWPSSCTLPPLFPIHLAPTPSILLIPDSPNS